MPPDCPAPGSPDDWLRHARSDLSIASAKKRPSVLYAHLCFHAQQAAEKALKAVLVRRRVSFPRTHDLAFLLNRLPRNVAIPPALIDLPVLNKYAVQQRYPGEMPEVTARHRKQAVLLAEETIKWASRLCSK